MNEYLGREDHVEKRGEGGRCGALTIENIPYPPFQFYRSLPYIDMTKLYRVYHL